MDAVISAVDRTYPKRMRKKLIRFDYEKELETCTIMQDKRWFGEAVIDVLDNAVSPQSVWFKNTYRFTKKKRSAQEWKLRIGELVFRRMEYHQNFQRFYRGSSKEVMEKSGTGIGLFLSRNYQKKTRRYDYVTSGKRKKGSTFVIQFTICWLNFK